MHTIAGHSIVEYHKPEDWEAVSGILLPSVMEQRRMMKLKDHTISADAPPPDIYRLGRLVAGEIEVPHGHFVLFNRHDSEEFEYEGTTYHRINNLNALAYVSPEALSL